MTYLLLALTAFSAQAMLVVPVVPILLSAGALAAHGEMHPVLAIVALTLGVVPGDTVWYALGRVRGGSILNRVCRASLEPADCRQRAQNVLTRYGAKTLVVGKFIPGLSTLLLPMAGVYGMKPRRFLLYDACGVLTWCAVYVLVGYVSARQLMFVQPETLSLNSWLLALLIGTVPAYFVWRYLRLRWYTRQMRVKRVSADALERTLASGAPVTVVDLRHPLDFEADPYTIPGALYIPADQLKKRRKEIPRKAYVVLYCTCPEEHTSVKAAAHLRTRGVRKVRPLQGGFHEWRARGYPVEFRGPLIAPDDRAMNAA